MGKTFILFLALMGLGGAALHAAPERITCPHPKELTAEALPAVAYKAGEGWNGEAQLGKINWFFDGTSPVETGKGGKAQMTCNYGNRASKVSLTMVHPTLKAASCKQDACEKIKGKGASQKMLEACAFTCGS